MRPGGQSRLCGPAGVLIAASCAVLGCAKAAPIRLVEAPAVAGPEFDLRLPLGFPAPLVPADNPLSAAKVRLGRRLFYDRALSGNGTFSCASCHRQELAFTDGRAQAVGSTGELHPRSAMSLANAAYDATLTWANPELRTLEDQARVPMFNRHPVELGLADREEQVLERFRSDPDYVRMFRAAFDAEPVLVTMDSVVRALASFVRTLISGDSPYHRLVYRGEMDALSESARRGMRLFFSERLGCANCHAGFMLSGPVVFEGAAEIEPTFHNTGLYDIDGKGAYPPGNRGLYERTGRPEDMGRFRAPTLSNVAITAPYMHDGSIESLEELVDFYAAGGAAGGNRTLDRRRPPQPQQERSDPGLRDHRRRRGGPDPFPGKPDRPRLPDQPVVLSTLGLGARSSVRPARQFAEQGA